MTLHCARCGRTLIDGTIIVATMQKAEFDERTENVIPKTQTTVIAYYCEDCMRCMH